MSLSVHDVLGCPGIFHMRIMGAFIDQLGCDIFHTDQVRYEMDFYGHIAAVEFAQICDRYFEVRKEKGGRFPNGNRHCKVAEVLIDGERIRAEYSFCERMGGHVAEWIDPFDDLTDVTKVKLTMLLSEFHG